MLPLCDFLEGAVAVRLFEDGYDALVNLQVLARILFLDHMLNFIS